jgi:hypothetical protein
MECAMAKVSEMTGMTYTLYADRLFPAGQRDAMERKMPDGTVVRSSIDRDGKPQYSAFDAKGKPLKITRLRLSNGGPEGAGNAFMSPEDKCYFCFCDDNHCQCTPEACPDLP